MIVEKIYFCHNSANAIQDVYTVLRWYSKRNLGKEIMTLYIHYFLYDISKNAFLCSTKVEASSDLRSGNGFKLYITNISILKVRFFFNGDTPKMTKFKLTPNILDKSHELICKYVVQIQKRQEKNKDREKKEGTRGH